MAPITVLHRPGARLAVALMAGLSLAVMAPVSAFAQDTDKGDPPVKQSADEAREPAKGEARLARMLEGRVAGEPQNCIFNLPTDQMTTIDKTAYVFGRGNTIYVQRTSRPENIDDRDTLVTRRFGGGRQLCRQDIATTIDPLTQFFTGAVMFEDFVPYARIDKPESSAGEPAER